MLVLSVKVNEHIKIGEDIWITVVSAGRNRVRIGITAPKEVPILREELLNDEDKKGEGCQK